MSKTRGYSWVLEVESSDQLESERNVELEINGNVIDVSDKSNTGFTDNINGLRSWTVNAEGPWIYDGSAWLAIETAAINGTAVTVTVKDTVGLQKYSGSAYVSSFKHAAPADNIVSASVSFVNAGALTKSTY